MATFQTVEKEVVEQMLNHLFSRFTLIKISPCGEILIKRARTEAGMKNRRYG